MDDTPLATVIQPLPRTAISVESASQKRRRGDEAGSAASSGPSLYLVRLMPGRAEDRAGDQTLYWRGVAAAILPPTLVMFAVSIIYFPTGDFAVMRQLRLAVMAMGERVLKADQPSRHSGGGSSRTLARNQGGDRSLAALLLREHQPTAALLHQLEARATRVWSAADHRRITGRENRSDSARAKPAFAIAAHRFGNRRRRMTERHHAGERR